MTGKAFIIPILIIALVGFVATPPVHAELATVTALLAAGFITTVLVVEAVETISDDSAESDQKDRESEPSEKETEDQARLPYSTITGQSRPGQTLSSMNAT